MKSSNFDRRLKRRWLCAIGALKRESIQPSSSKPISAQLTSALIDETLGSIKDDDVWVALACIDAINQRISPLPKDAVLLRHILVLGLQKTEKSVTSAEEALNGPEQTIRLLAARTRLLRFMRILNVWEKVYGPEADKLASRWEIGEDYQSMNADEDEEADAWAELQDTTPSPIASQNIRSLALDFILSSPTKKAMELAMAAQPLQLNSFLRALPKALASEIFPQRFVIVKALIIAISVSGVDMNVLMKSQLLPIVKEGKEDGLWVQMQQGTNEGESDFCDLPEIRQVLQSRGMSEKERSEGFWQNYSHSEILTSTELCTFYKEALQLLEQQVASILSAAQLAFLLSSKEFGLPNDDEFIRLVEDLQLFKPLIYGQSSSPQVRQWSLTQFRQACSAAAFDTSARTDLTFLYIGNAREEETAQQALEVGILPLLRSLAKREALDAPNESQIEAKVQRDLIELYIRLVEKGRIMTLSSLLVKNDEEGIILSLEEKIRILIAAVLHSKLAERQTQEALQSSLDTMSSLLDNHISAQNKTISQGRRHLCDVVGSALKQIGSVRSSPSLIYKLLENSTIEDLSAFLKRIKVCQEASIRLSMFTDQISVAWLVNVEGKKDDQLIGISRFVRSFGRSANHSQMFLQFAMALHGNVGGQNAFDQLNEKDIGKVVLEGAARVGDLHLFDQILQSEIGDILTTQEKEDIILDASEELYDNSNSANLHQGDMKLAYDILSRVPNSSNSKATLQFKAFIEATSRLCSYRVPSKIHTGTLLSPIEIRLSTDRINLIRLLLSARSDAYRTPDVVLDVAYKLCAIAPGARQEKLGNPLPHRSQVENTVLALMIDAALSQGDYSNAQSFCEKLVTNVVNLGKRVEQIRNDDQSTTITIELYKEGKSLAHRTCHQLSKQPDWNDFTSRLRWSGFALAFCPSEQIDKYLQNWRTIASELEREIERNPPKEIQDILIEEKNGIGGGTRLNLTSTTSSLMSRGGGGLSAALQAGTGGLSAAGLAALSQFGGNLESYANPLGALFSRAPSAIRPLASSSSPSTNLTRSGSQRSTNSNYNQNLGDLPGSVPMASQSSNDNLNTNQIGSPISRAARLFDGLGGGNTGTGNSTSSTGGTPSEGMPGYMDPAERAARAARRFFSGLGG